MNINPHLPFGDQEIILIASQRALNALKGQKPDYAVGFCEGIIQNEAGCFTAVWCAVVNSTGKCFLGGGMHVPLDESLMQKLQTGLLIEEDVEAYLQKHFSNAYQQLVEFALLPVSQS